LLFDPHFISRKLILILAAGAALAAVSHAVGLAALAGAGAHWGVAGEGAGRINFPSRARPSRGRRRWGWAFPRSSSGREKAYTAGHANEADTVFCFDALTGKEIWKHSYPAELGDKFL
jgi:hypothetical protein